MRTRFSTLAVLLLLFASMAFCQGQIDSLRKIVAEYSSGKEPDKRLGLTYTALARAYLITDLTEAQHGANLGLAIGQRLNDPHIIGEAHSILGIIYSKQGLKTLALAECTKAYESIMKLNIHGAEAFVLCDLGNLYFSEGIYDVPLDYYRRAAELFKSQKDPELGLAVAYNNIALCYRNTLQYDSALDYFHTALQLRQKLPYPSLLVHSYNYISEVHRRAGNNDSALFYAKKALTYLGRMEIRLNEEFGFFGESYRLLARIYEKMGNSGEVINAFNAAIRLYTRVNHTTGLAEAYTELSRYCLKNGKYADALGSAREVLSLQMRENSLDGMNSAHILLGDIFSAMKQYRQSSEHYSQALRLADSLNNVNIGSRSDAVGYTLETIRNQSAFEVSQEKNRARGYLYGAFLSILFLIVVVLFFRLRLKNREEEKLRGLINSTFEGIAIARSGIIVAMNGKFAELLEYTQEELIGTPFAGHVADEALREVIDQRRDSSEAAEYAVGLLTKSGRLLTAEVLSRGIEHEGKHARIIAIRDITLKAEAARETERARAETERVNRAKTEFLANVSHEIRTPMNAILGFADLLRGHVTDHGARGYIDSIVNSGKNLLNLLNDILDVAKMEAGKYVIRSEPADLRAVSGELARTYELQAKTKNLLFEFHQSSGFPGLVLIDETRYRQICTNLLSNAVKFTAQGSIRFSVSHAGIKDDDTKADVIITVGDTGIGIRESDQALIFEAFHQADAQSSRKFAGTGLGLTITKRLAELMNASVGLESAPGKGAKFTVTFRDVPVFKNPEVFSRTLDKDSKPVPGELQYPEAIAGNTLPAEELLLRIAQLKNGMVISEIEEMSQELLSSAETQKNARLRELATALRQKIETYNPEGIGSALEALEIYLHSIQKQERKLASPEKE